MIYYKDKEILIRDMLTEDAQMITDEENAHGWHQNIEKYEMRLQHQVDRKAIVLTAEYEGNIAGYINIYPDAKYKIRILQGTRQ